jgi:hypothetical protein
MSSAVARTPHPQLQVVWIHQVLRVSTILATLPLFTKAIVSHRAVSIHLAHAQQPTGLELAIIPRATATLNVTTVLEHHLTL